MNIFLFSFIFCYILLKECDAGPEKSKKMNRKRDAHLRHYVKFIESSVLSIPSLTAEQDFSQHVRRNDAVFAAALDPQLDFDDILKFVGTLRQTNFTGDIVLGLLPDSKPRLLKQVQKYNCIVTSQEYSPIRKTPS